MAKNTFYITTPIYYVNDQPHIGHAYTTIAADVLARYHRQKGEEVFFLTGTDEHGSKVAESAAKEGKSSQEFCDEVANAFKKVWKVLNISNDYFIRTTDKDHKKRVQEIFTKLKDAKTPQGNEVIYQGEYKGLYCTGCEKFLTEKELVNGKCPDHEKEPEELVEKNYFFRLKDYLPEIQKKIESDEFLILPKKRRQEALGLIKQGIDDFSVSRETVKWGIDLPFDKSQKAYVWVDALSNYITALGYPPVAEALGGKPDQPDNFQKFWPADAHLMAQDILKFHTIYWPAILLALDVDLPRAEFIHGFFTINGQKMSKSLGNAIDPIALADKYAGLPQSKDFGRGADVTRYLLLSQFSFGSESDVQAERFDEKYNAELGNKLGNLIMRVTNLLEQHNDGRVLEVDLSKEWQIDSKTVDKYYQEYKIDLVLRTIWEKIEFLNKQIDEAQPWKTIKDEATKSDAIKVLSQAVLALRQIAKYLESFMPETAEKIKEQLKEPLKKGEPLFPRI